MQCLECRHPTSHPGLVVAMEQRQHLALERQAEVCPECAGPFYSCLKEAGQGSRYWSQCVNCALCGARMPAMRLRFELRGMGLKHVALCSGCYNGVRRELMRPYPNVIAWVDKEWDTTDQAARRLPWPAGTVVRVLHHATRFRDRVGVVQSCRGLVQPYFGYEVSFDETRHHFFHERDLEPLMDKESRPAA